MRHTQVATWPDLAGELGRPRGGIVIGLQWLTGDLGRSRGRPVTSRCRSTRLARAVCSQPSARVNAPSSSSFSLGSGEERAQRTDPNIAELGFLGLAECRSHCECHSEFRKIKIKS